MHNTIWELEKQILFHNSKLELYGLKRESENKEGFLNTYILRCDYTSLELYKQAIDRVYGGIVGMISGFPKIQALKYKYKKQENNCIPSHVKICIIDKV
jgi:hypothetical protein